MAQAKRTAGRPNATGRPFWGLKQLVDGSLCRHYEDVLATIVSLSSLTDGKLDMQVNSSICAFPVTQLTLASTTDLNVANVGDEWRNS